MDPSHSTTEDSLRASPPILQFEPASTFETRTQHSLFRTARCGGSLLTLNEARRLARSVFHLDLTVLAHRDALDQICEWLRRIRSSDSQRSRSPCQRRSSHLSLSLGTLAGRTTASFQTPLILGTPRVILSGLRLNQTPTAIESATDTFSFGEFDAVQFLKAFSTTSNRLGCNTNGKGVQDCTDSAMHSVKFCAHDFSLGRRTSWRID